jgi:hypothetical protein
VTDPRGGAEKTPGQRSLKLSVERAEKDSMTWARRAFAAGAIAAVAAASLAVAVLALVVAASI